MRLHIRPIDDWNDARKAEKLARQQEKRPVNSRRLNELLVKAAKGGKVKTAELLLNQGASPDAQICYQHGTSPVWYPVLSEVVYRNDLPMARLLIDHKADLSKADTFTGHTPVHQAAINNRPALMRLMLDAGARLGDITSIHSKENIKYITGVTPLEIAENRGYNDIATMLKEEPRRRQAARAASAAQIRNSATAVTTPKIKTGAEAGEAAAKGPETRAAMKAGDLTASWNDRRLAEKIARRSVKSPFSTAQLNTMLLKAIKRGRPATAKQLLTLGATPDLKYSYQHGWTTYTYPVLNDLVERGDVTMARLLIDHKADLSAADTLTGHTPLHSAAIIDSPVFLRLLLDAGARLNQETSIHSKENIKYIVGVTALSIARGHGYADAVKILSDEPERRRRVIEAERAKIDEAAKAEAAARAKAAEEERRRREPVTHPLLSIKLQLDGPTSAPLPPPKPKQKPGQMP